MFISWKFGRKKNLYKALFGNCIKKQFFLIVFKNGFLFNIFKYVLKFIFISNTLFFKISQNKWKQLKCVI